ncbi:MAG: endonuclease domain-containing protein, partial [Armatimonadota bacterium]
MSDHRRRRVVSASAAGKVKFAREQRRQPTPGEQVLWQALRRQKLGVRFRRQHPIGDFVLDFYCAERGLAIEVDGSSHEGEQARDQWREAELLQLGIRVIRLPDKLVRSDLAAALRIIRRALDGGRSGAWGAPPPPP